MALSQESSVLVSTIQDICWSPNSKSIYFSGMWHKPDYSDYSPENWNVYRHDLSSGKSIRIVDNAMYVTVSPTGDNIAVGKIAGGNRDIIVFDFEGNYQYKLTAHDSTDSAPAWSPDGRWVAFNSERDGRPAIFLIDSDGNGLRKIPLDESVSNYNPQWSPGSDKIVYYTEKGDSRDQIFITDLDGSNPQNITSDTLHNYFPSWTQDNKIIYTMDLKNGNSRIIRCNPSGGRKEWLQRIESYYARVSPDGIAIAYIDAQERCIKIVNSIGDLKTTIYLPEK
jgi:Tol biopolymer transport system component